MKSNSEKMEKIGLNIVIERERSHFIATSPDINVFAEGKTIDEAVSKFREGAKFHLESFPEERNSLAESNEEKFEMPILTKIFL